MAIGDTYQAAIIWDNIDTADICVNVFHYRQDTPIVQPSGSRDLFAAIRQDVLPVIAPAIHNRWQQTRGNMFNVDNPSEGESRTGVAIVGGGVAQCMPFDDSAVITWLTGFRGRSFRGRTSLPPFDEAGHTGNGVIDAGTLTLMTDFGNAAMLIAATGAHAQWTLVIRSRILSISTPVVSFTAAGIFGSQERRKLGS